MWFRNTSKKDNHNVINVSNQTNDIQTLILQELIKINKTIGKVISQIKDYEKRLTKLENGGRG